VFLQGADEHHIDAGGPDPTPAGTNKQGQSVGLRWLTALIAMPVILVFAWFGGWAAFAATAVVTVMGLLELRTMLHHAGYRPLMWVSFALGLLFLLAAMLPQVQLVLLEMGLGGALLVSFVMLFFRKNIEGAVVDWAFTLAIAIYIGLPMSFFLLLRGNDPGSFGGAAGLHLSRGIWWLLVVLLGVWGFDSAAFFAGRYLGRHRVAPHISPGKTWEGIAGGMLLSIITALLFTVLPLGISWYLAILLGLLIGAAAVFGDLAESLIKRQVHVKDSGQIMPGHGGLLDRIDSLLFAVIVVYIFAQFVGK
jgi:phosphatidate cytidylyltransferase